MSKARVLSQLSFNLAADATVPSTSFTLANSGVTAGTYGSASQVPILVIDAKGRVTSASTTSVAGVSSFGYNTSTGVLTINTADGGSYTAGVTLAPFTTTNLAEGTNQYFTNARARSAVSATGSLSYNSSTGVFSYTQGNTDTVSEGTTNLYFTNTRSRASISSTTGSAGYNSTTGVITIPSTSSHITEGSNLFYTDARARAAVSASTGLSYTSSTGVFTIDSTVATLTGTQTLTNKSISGATNTLSAIPNSALSNSSVTVGTTSIALGASSTTLAGLTSVTSTSFVGALTGNASTATTLATARTIALTGDVTYTSGSFDGSANVTGTATLANSGVTAGTYNTATAITPITVDAKGRITSAATAVTITPAWSSITSTPTTISGYGITDAYTKTQVDAFLQGLDPKASVIAATTANITLSATQTIDGVALSVGDRVLVKSQTTASQNGIYVVASGSWTRATDMDIWAEVPGTYVFVEKGTLYADTGWVSTADAGGTIDTTAMAWVQFAGAGSYTGTAPITITGTAISLATTGTAGTYTKVTTDSYGRVSSGTTLSSSDLPTYTGTITSSQVTTALGFTPYNSTNPSGYLTGTKIDSITATTPIVASASTGAVTLSHATSGVTAGTYNNVTVNATGHVTSGSNTSYLTANQNITLSGDISGSGTTAITATLATVNSNVGTFNNVTVNAKGLVTAASNVSYLTSYTETDTLATVTGRGATTSTVTTFSGGDGSNSSIKLAGYNQRGGAGYHGFLEATNTYASATTPNKYFRLDSSGSLQIVNSAYTATILALTDAGALTVTSTIGASNFSGTHSGTSSGTNTGDQTITLTGDVTGSGTGSFATTLASSGVTAGSYTYSSITVDAKGRVTSASSGTAPVTTSVAATSPIVTSGATGSITLTHAASGVTAGTYNNVTVNATGHVTSGSNTSYLTSYTETDTLATVTGRGATTSAQVTVDSVLTTNNGNGTNFRIGDDSWIGDINVANTFRVTGLQDGTKGYIVFGNSDNTALGRSGTGALTYGGNTIYHSGNIPSYLTSESDTLATVTARGATTSTLVRINNQLRVGQNTNGTAYIDAYDGYAWFGRDSNTAGVRIDASGNVLATAQLSTGSYARLGGGTSNPASTTFSHTLAGVSTNRVVNFDGNGNGAPSVWWTSGSRAYGAIDAKDPGLTFWANNGSGWQQQFEINYGNVTVNTDIRSPIFYDSNDTAYYLDPNSTTRVNNLTVVGTLTATVTTSDTLATVTGRGSSTSTDITIGNGGADTGIRINHGAGSGDYGRIRFYQAGTNNQTIHVFSTAWQGGTLASASAGAINLTGANGVTFGAWNDPAMWISTAGDGQAKLSLRAPVFYDSNDTAYYLDPNSTSNIVTLNVNNYLNVTTSRAASSHGYAGNFVASQSASSNFIPFNFTSSRGNHSWGIVGRFRTDNSSDTDRPSIQFSSAFNDTRWNIGYAGSDDNFRLVQNMGYRNDNATSDGWGTTRLLVDTSGNFYSYASTRSPIFYDQDDTGYYVDPNSGTRLNSLTINDGNVQLYKSQTIDMSNTGVYSTSNYYPVVIGVPTDGVWIEIQNNLNSNVPSWSTHGAGFTLNLRWWTNGSGWGTTEVKRRVEQYHERFTNSTICGGITQMTNSSIEVVWLRGGGSYYFKFSRNLSASAQSSTYTSNSQSVSPTSSAQNGVWNSASGSHTSYNTNVYSGAFYDWDDTGYYLDPNSTGTSLNIAGGISTPLMWVNYSTSNNNNYNEGIRLYSASNGAAVITFNSGGTGGSAYGSLLGFTDRFEQRWAGSWQERMYNGYMESAGSYRAPIFYDSNDTTYYLDPNSGTTSINTAGSIRGSYYVASNYGSTGYTQYKGYDNNNHFIVIRGIVGGNTTTPTITGGHNTTLVEYAEANDSTGWFFRTAQTGNYDIVSRITRSYSSFVGSARAPVFYDSDNTGYYLDPNSGFNFVCGAATLSSSTSGYFVNNAEGSGSNVRLGAAWGYPGIYNGGSIYLMSEANVVFRTQNVDRGYMDSSYNLISYGSVRGTIFYDQNDTGYYVDPNSVTRLYSTSVYAGNEASNTGGNGSTEGFILRGNYNSNTWAKKFHNYDNGSGIQLYLAETVGASSWNTLQGWGYGLGYTSRVFGSFRVDSGFYTNIFYDTDNTGYYCDPTGGSNLNTANANRFSAPNNGLISVGDDSATQTYNDGSTRSRIYVSSAYPVVTLNSTVTSGNSNHGPTLQFTHNGYDSSRQWVIGTGGSGQQLDFGTAQPSNKNPHEGIAGYSGTTCMRMTVAGNVGIGGSWGAYGTVANPSYRMHVQGTGYASSDFRAPIFYDSDDTEYYMNPNAYSQINGIGSVNGSAGVGMAIYSSVGANSGSIMSFHRAGRYAVNFGLDSDNVIRIGGWSASANRLQMDMSGNLTMAGNVTAYSDERLKKDWSLLPSNFIEQLALVKSGTYTRIDSEERQVGVSAQGLKEFLAEAVQTDADGMLSVNYGGAALASAVELAKKVIEQETRIAKLEALIETLINKLGE